MKNPQCYSLFSVSCENATADVPLLVCVFFLETAILTVASCISSLSLYVAFKGSFSVMLPACSHKLKDTDCFALQ